MELFKTFLLGRGLQILFIQSYLCYIFDQCGTNIILNEKFLIILNSTKFKLLVSFYNGLFSLYNINCEFLYLPITKSPVNCFEFEKDKRFSISKRLLHIVYWND